MAWVSGEPRDPNSTGRPGDGPVFGKEARGLGPKSGQVVTSSLGATSVCGRDEVAIPGSNARALEQFAKSKVAGFFFWSFESKPRHGQRRNGL